MPEIRRDEDKPPNYDETVSKHQKRPIVTSSNENDNNNNSQPYQPTHYRHDDFAADCDYDEYVVGGGYGCDEETTTTTAVARVYQAIDHENFVQKQIELNYPLTYVLVDSTLMIVLNVVLVGLQVVATRNNAALSYLSSAIWAAIYNLVVVGMLLATIKFRSSTLIMLTSTLKLFGMIISFVGFVLINLVAFYHYNCRAASYYRPCYNRDMKPVHYAIIGVGIPCMLLSVAVFIYFQFKLLARHKFVGGGTAAVSGRYGSATTSSLAVTGGPLFSARPSQNFDAMNM